MQKDKNPFQTLNIAQFISISTQLAIEACQIIKAASLNKHLKTFHKTPSDPVTQADLHIQTMIVTGLKKFFPNLLVIGQEEVSYKGNITIDYNKLSLDFTPQNVKFASLELPYDEICVWIDPIDCTYGFIDGNLEQVTTLIGMSWKNQAWVGVIGCPFKKDGDERKYLPCVNIGVVPTKEAFVYNQSKTWHPLTPKPIHTPPLITTSQGRVDQLFQQIVSHLNGQSKYSGGAGRKCMMVINGETDLMAYIAGYTSKWDTCAGQALVKAMGGYFLTKNKTQQVYDPKATNFTNFYGQICSLDKDLFDKVYEYLEKINPTLNWQNFKPKYVQKKYQLTLNIKQFMSVASQLALSACEIINQAHKTMDMQQYKSAILSTTEADYHVQTMIITGLKKFFPKLKVVGEEQHEFKGKMNVDYDKFVMDFCPSNVKFDNLEVPYDELCAWIDPIDSTYGLIQGKTEYVTTLIGLARKNSAYAGIIGTPFKKVEQARQYVPEISIGVTQTKQAFIFSSKQQWHPLTIQPLNKPLLIASSGRKMTSQLQKLLSHLNAKFKLSGGSGKKAMLVVTGQADLLMYRQYHTCMWDSCAGEAIVKAMGGYYVTYDNKALVYDPESKDFLNADGQICTLHKEVLDMVLEYRKNSGK